MRRRIICVRISFRNDEGATLPLVALSLVVIIGMASLVIDLGNGWRVRRALIPATDAAALAAAQDYAQGNNGCDLSASNYLTLNEPLAVLDSCTPSGGSSGYVTVTASHNVDTWFAGVLGFGNYDVTSSSTAAWGPLSGAVGLRPIGLCIEGSDELADIVYNPPSGPTLVHIEWTKEQPSDCGDTAGNWGTIDLDGGIGGGNADMVEWLRNGYDGEVIFEDHTVTTCSGEVHCLPSDPGADLVSGIPELNALRSSGKEFTLPLFNFVEDNGQAWYHVIGIVKARLVNFKINGAAANRYIDLMVNPGFVPGTTGGSGSGTGGNMAVSLCAVDASNVSGCTP